MGALIALVRNAESESFGSSAEELIVASLLATPAPLLKIFSHSNALKHVDVWLAKAAAAESHGHAMQLLALLAKMPMSIASLQGSGVGRTVNKLRKASEPAVQGAAASLLKDWKAVANESATTSAQMTTGSKRTLCTSASNHEKRAKTVAPVGSASLEDEHSLDSAFASATVPRKASLKPDFIKPRRPVKSVTMSMGPSAISCSAAVSPVVATKPGSAGGSRSAKGERHPTGSTQQRAMAVNDGVVGCEQTNGTTARVHAIRDDTPVGAGALPALRNATLPFEMEVPRAKNGRRVTWAAALELVEERTYLCEERGNGLGHDFHGQVHQQNLPSTG
jgi:hypothetical protein